MRVWMVSLVALVVGLCLGGGAQAHGRHYGGISVGFGLGYPYGRLYYDPYPYYYPRALIGVDVWPRGRARRVRSTEAGATQLKQLYVYPAAGQSETQLADDRYACHTWSVDQTGFDPTLGAGDEAQADAYARAMTACLEARNYVVR